MDTVSCNLCGGVESVVIATKGRYDSSCVFVQCRSCGLVYMNPRLTTDELADFYKRAYRDLYNPGCTPERFDRDTLPTAVANVKWVVKFTKPGGPKTILDIGCATGNFLRLLSEAGWENWGVEPDSGYASYGQSKGLSIINGTLENTRIPEYCFDAVTMFHTLEHLVSPLESLHKVRSLLKPEGKLFVVVPNLNNLSLRIRKRYANYYFQPAHNYEFTIRTLKRMLQRAGFSVVSCKTRGIQIGVPGGLDRVVETSQGTMATFFRRLLVMPYRFTRNVAGVIVGLPGWGEEIRVVARKQPEAHP